jgi:predicted esterase YcpF (UPF0227 family)
MSKSFKTIKAINSIHDAWYSVSIPIGTILEQIPDTKNLINPIKGIAVEFNNEIIGVPYEFIVTNYEYKTTILLFHGFNSAPENKLAIINQWLIDNNLSDRIDLIAPQLNYNPNEAIKQIGSIIQEHYGNIIVMGTSLGGFYANYVRAMNQTDQIKVHAINPSWSPIISLKKEINQHKKNLKTEENWIFTEAYLNYLASFEKKCKEELKHYNGNHFTFHLANYDELLGFDEMLEYLKENKVPNKQFYYDTVHRFEKVDEMLENIKSELISM